MGATKEEALVWGHTVEGLVRCGTPRWVERLRAAGLDLEKPIASVYTRDQWRSFIFISAEELFQGPLELRLENLGSAFDYADGYAGESGEDENSEPAELRAAREAALTAEREAQEARDELSYQECLAPCAVNEVAEPDPSRGCGSRTAARLPPGCFNST